MARAGKRRPLHQLRPALQQREYSRESTGPWTNRPQNITITFANIDNLFTGTQYWVQVRAKNAHGESSWSLSGTARTNITAAAPGEPTDLTATANGQNRIDLNWTPGPAYGVPPVRSYKIEIKSDASNWLTLVPTTSNTDTVYSHTDLPAGTLRHYRVSAINTNGTGPASNIAEATTEDLDQLDQVMGVSITPRDGALKITWTEVTEARGYKVQWTSGGANYNSGSRQATITSGLTTEHRIGGLTNSTEYTVRVIATRYPINDGPPSETATQTPRAGAGGGGGGGRTPAPDPQMQQSQTPLTASFASVPPAHDGETPFWLELTFDAPVAQGSKPQLQALLEVTGGVETRFRRKNGQLDHWQIRIAPSSQNAVTVMLSPSPPCGDSGAVCTNDGRTFTTGLATQIHGPASGNNWSDDSAGTAVTPVPALPLAGIGILGLLLAVLGSRRTLNNRRQLDASRGR